MKALCVVVANGRKRVKQSTIFLVHHLIDTVYHDRVIVELQTSKMHACRVLLLLTCLSIVPWNAEGKK